MTREATTPMEAKAAINKGNAKIDNAIATAPGDTCTKATLVEIRSSEYDAISFETMTTVRGGTSFIIHQEDGNDYGKSFFFDGPEEARAFARRILDSLNAFIDPSPYEGEG